MKLTQRGRDALFTAQFMLALLLTLGIVGMLDGVGR